MNFSYQNLASIETILADVLPAINDEDTRLLSIGWYRRVIKAGLEKLNFHTKFDQRYLDLDMPEDLKMEMPAGSWEIRDLFAFTGDCCKVGASSRIFKKSNYLSKGKDMGYTARNKSGQWDYFIIPFQNDSSLLYYGIQRGLIMLSEACSGFEKVRIVFNGTPTDIHATKMIPHFAKEALIAYTVERAFFTLKVRDPKYRAMWVDAKIDLYSPSSVSEWSKWDNAKWLLKDIDKKEWDDLAEYLSKLNC